MSKKIKKLSVTITYTVSLGDLENVPENVYEQLEKAYDNAHSVSPTDPRMRYSEAADWLSNNIRERDCMDWECEIDGFE